ncbi:peroxisomal multifunctional enzyme type 2 [Contarinia nasturtii]|uniref:peroxisomal multifunctional enzyme type 2 n=1 Tax=Contarinia nasturtii TaxID=265458 RepID=UPI0012D430B3|nr:peroxisomal multifunctional enzyme type 2 [Contarinia nasturtii]XP_031618011.1 peroxisomal multifunctional enzyme type 2 [Contarinia nasturtii]
MSANDQLRFDGRVAIVTGAGAGLGREYALLFAERGAKVVVNDLGGSTSGEGSSKAADIVVNEIRAKGGIACANYDSVTDGDKIIKTAMDNFGRVDILVNNAGVLRDKSFAKISEQDLNIIMDVHFKGSFKTTQAAWPIFKKQNYGRIIMTTSNSGIYGNFGQANYGAAKMALVGLCNTLAIEGERNNIHCNCIVPTAASRLTQDVLPEILYNELKPKLIAPVVTYLCHESSTDNGAIIESAAGWATKLHTVRGKGAILRSSIMEDVTPEKVRDAWERVTDMSNTERMSSIAEATGSLVGILDQLEVDQKAGSQNGQQHQDIFSFGNKDLILYALGVGCTVKDSIDLKFLYENHPDFTSLPTYFIMPALLLAMSSTLTQSAITHTQFDLSQVLHGEQYLEVCDELPTEGSVSTSGSVIDVVDKRSGAVVVLNCDSFDQNGKLLFKNQLSTFVVGAGNFGGKTKASDEVKPVIPTPNRPFDASIKYTTSVDQAALYRLSGDLNPLHIDPEFAKLGGHKVPIMHGLCTLGFSVRAILSTYADNDASLFKAVKARFTKPAIPGQTLEIQMWQNGNRIHFKTVIVDTGIEVITSSYVDLKEVKKSKATPMANSSNSTKSSVELKSDVIFQTISERIKENIEKAKSVNGIFLYNITKDGQIAKKWTIDLKSAILYEGPPNGVNADTTLTVNDDDFVDIALGKINPQVAFMKGKLKIAGNIMLTQKLLPLLKTGPKL